MLFTPKLREKDCIHLFLTVLYLPPMVFLLKIHSGSFNYLVFCLPTPYLEGSLYLPLSNFSLLLSFSFIDLFYLSLFLFFLLPLPSAFLLLFWFSFLDCFSNCF